VITTALFVALLLVREVVRHLAPTGGEAAVVADRAVLATGAACLVVLAFKFAELVASGA
jgi:hypothetical protein